MLLDQFSALTVDSVPIAGHFILFLARLENQVRAKLGPEPPKQACRCRNFFLGPIPELFFCQCFVVFPGSSKNNVDPADPTLFFAFPGNARNYVGSNPDLAFQNGAQKKVPESAGLVGDVLAVL